MFTNWLTWVSKFLIDVLVSYWNCKVLEAKVLTISSKDGLNFVEEVEADKLVGLLVERNQEDE